MLVQPRGQLGHVELAQSCGGELDREREAVERGAELRHVGGVVAERISGANGGSPVLEQAHGGVGGQRLEREQGLTGQA